MKRFLICSVFLLILATTLEAQWRCGGKRCCGCRRYFDLTDANYDGIPYGYVDNLNYPDTYRLPLNRCFNYRPDCSYGNYNVYYLRNCIHYTNRTLLR